MTTTNRSEFLGVYNNTQEKSKSEVPFRVAIRRSRQGQAPTWINLGYINSEKVAARVYNMYAINFFGKGAIVNDFGNMTPEETAEFEAFISAKEKRTERYNTAKARAQAIVADGGKFRTHVELQAAQTTHVQQWVV